MTRRETDPAGRAAIRKFASTLVSLEKRVEGLAKGRLGSSSLENAAILSYDGEGVLASIIGRQWDDGNTIISVNGPNPPAPAALTVTPVPTGLHVQWAGDWAAGGTTVAPSDFSHVEIHVSTDPGFSGLFFDTMRGQVGSARGGWVIVPWPPDVPAYARAVSRSIPGKFTPGTVSGPFLAGKVTQDELDVDFSTLGGSTIFYGSATPTTTQIGDLWYAEVTVPTTPPSTSYEVRRWDGDSWEPVADQDVGDALLLAEAADAAAADRAMLFAQPAEPTGLTAADVAIWVDTDDGNRSYTWSGTAWVSRRIGNGAIEPQSLVASNVIATGTVTAALLEAVMVLATTLVGGVLTAAHVELDGGGLRLYDVTPDGDVEQSGAFGTGADGLTLTDPVTKQTMTSVRREGIATSALSVTGVDLDGDELADAGFQVYGREFLDYLDDLPRGIVASGTYAAVGGSVVNGVSTPLGLFELGFTARAGRSYRILFDGIQLSGSAGQVRALVSMRGTEGGVTPTTSNGVSYEGHFVDLPIAGEAYGAGAFSFNKTWSLTADVEVRLLYVVERQSGTTAGSTINVRTYEATDRYFAPVRWSVSDDGPAVEDNLLMNNGGGDTSGGGTASPTTKKSYTTTWNRTWSATWLGDGSKRTDADMIQGSTSGYVAGGNQRAAVGFTSGAPAAYSNLSSEVGKTIVQALTGATVTKVEVRLHCNHAWSFDGGLASIGYHGHVSEPSGWPTAAYNIFTKFFKRGETIWVPLPSATYADFKSGNYRGIVVGPVSAANYMRFDGDSGTKPAIRITYTR